MVAVFLPHPHMAQILSVIFVRALILYMRALKDPVTSSRPHLLMALLSTHLPKHWGLAFHMWVMRGHRGCSVDWRFTYARCISSRVCCSVLYLSLTTLNYTLKNYWIHLISYILTTIKKKKRKGRKKRKTRQWVLRYWYVWHFASPPAWKWTPSVPGMLIVLFPLSSHYLGQDENSFTSNCLVIDESELK